jgi:hypothetical protein
MNPVHLKIAFDSYFQSTTLMEIGKKTPALCILSACDPLQGRGERVGSKNPLKLPP